MLSKPTALSDIVVTNVILLLRNRVLGSTNPVHSPIFLCFLTVCRAALIWALAMALESNTEMKGC